ncbi:hypothetical protein HYW74_04200 [Candidatus Pacearchaeota archaeon]|nr:hypothetical protein [Candidatus Pacearchaeota archaeon]
MSEEKEIKEELKEVVIMRIETIPSNLKLAIGSDKALTKEEMIRHVKDGDSIGRQIINSHISFMKAVARGDFTRAITTI